MCGTMTVPSEMARPSLQLGNTLYVGIRFAPKTTCTAKWMWQMSYSQTPNVSIRCFGIHGDRWRPAPSLLRGISVEHKKIAIEQKVKYHNSTRHIASALSVSKRQLQNFLDNTNRKRRLHSDHFEAFKFTLKQIMESEDHDMKVIIPSGDLELFTINNFSVILISKNSLKYACLHGKLFEIIGHDGVYKLTEQGVPINIYTTVRNH